MKTVAIIQARLGSTRLPGKVMMSIAGRTMLEWVVSRSRKAERVDDVVVATTEDPEDLTIKRECRRLGVECIDGPTNDVLARFVLAAEAFDADPVVRITSDCPLIDPELIDRVVTAFETQSGDYASNALQPGYPRGLDVEVLSRATLVEASHRAIHDFERVHVTPYVYQHPDRFKLVSVPAPEDHSQLRWTVDCLEDLELVRRLVAHLGERDDFGWREALEVMKRHPSLIEINRHVRQKALEDG